MGYYINPHDMEKEDWLKKWGQEITNIVYPEDKEQLLICLVTNHDFTAAGWAFSPREMEDFLRSDGRNKVWYTIPREQALKDNVFGYKPGATENLFKILNK